MISLSSENARFIQSSSVQMRKMSCDPGAAAYQPPNPVTAKVKWSRRIHHHDGKPGFPRSSPARQSAHVVSLLSVRVLTLSLVTQ